MTRLTSLAGIMLALTIAGCGGGGSDGGGKAGFAALRPADNAGGFESTAPTPTPAAGTPSNCVGDNFEPNNSPADAASITPGSRLALNFCEDSIDIFALDVAPGAQVIAQTSELAANTDTVLTVRNAQGESLASNDDVDGTLASRVQLAVPAATDRIVIEVTQFNRSRTGPDTGYGLEVTVVGADQLLPDFVFGPSTVSGIDANRESEFSIEVLNQGTAASFADVGFYLSDDFEVGTDDLELTFVRTGTIEPGESEVLQGVVSFPSDRNGEFTFGLIVDDLQQVAESDETNNSTRFPRQRLGTPDQTCFDTLFGFVNDSSSSALLLTPPVDRPSRHCLRNEHWFAFEAVAGREYSVRTSRLADNANTQLRIEDNAGNLLVERGNVVGNLTQATFVAPRDELAFIRILHGEGQSGFDRSYTLYIRETQALPDLVAVISLPAGPLTAGSSVNASVTVANLGTAGAPATVIAPAAFEVTPVGRLATGDERSFFGLGSASVPPLAAGERATVSVNLTIPDASGSFVFSTAADPEGTVAELWDFDNVEGGNPNQGNFVPRMLVGGSNVKQARAVSAPAAPATPPSSQLSGE